MNIHVHRGPSHDGVTELSGGGHQDTSSTTCCHWGGSRPLSRPGQRAGLRQPRPSESLGCGPLSYQVAALCVWNRGGSAPLTWRAPTALLSALGTSSQGPLGQEAPRAAWKELEMAGLATNSGFQNSAPFIQRVQLSGLGRSLSQVFKFMNVFLGSGVAQKTHTSRFYERPVAKCDTASRSGAGWEDSRRCDHAPAHSGAACEATSRGAAGSGAPQRRHHLHHPRGRPPAAG